jgi:AcrR family transcriptional regulator
MLKNQGLAAISTPALAAEAGVSTSTLYRWWPTKEAIALDAFLEVVETQLPFDPKISSPLERIRDHIRNAARFLVCKWPGVDTSDHGHSGK